jgi:outer membrane protein OmpA-like peptidoglycan-associated protein
MKRLALLCVVLAFLLPACSKKQDSAKKPKATSSKTAKGKGIPVYKQDEEFLDDDAVSDFAFVDEDSKDTNKLAKDDSKTDKSLALVDNDAEELDLEDDSAIDQTQNEKYAFERVHFEFNKNCIRADQKAVLKKDIELARAVAGDGKEVVIQGHCDQLGEAAYNLVLSQRRAETVKTELVKAGLPDEKIKTVGYGFEMPLVWSDKKDRSELIKEYAVNRRAEIVVN